MLIQNIFFLFVVSMLNYFQCLLNCKTVTDKLSVCRIFRLAVFTKKKFFFCIVIVIQWFNLSLIYSFHRSMICTKVQENSRHFYKKFITLLMEM
jgi:hypothetical protein